MVWAARGLYLHIRPSGMELGVEGGGRLRARPHLVRPDRCTAQSGDAAALSGARLLSAAASPLSVGAVCACIGMCTHPVGLWLAVVLPRCH